MKKIILSISLMVALASSLTAQNVGINTASPQKSLSVNGSVLIDQDNTNLGNLDSAALLFGINKAGIFSNRNVAVTNWNGLDFWTGNTRRMVIASYGYVGINLGTAAPMYPLDVNGSIHAQGNITADNNLLVNNNTTIYGIATVKGNLVVAGTASIGGKGIVRSNSATNLRMGFSSGAYVITLPAGATTDVLFNITSFTGNDNNVRVSICQFITVAGSDNTWGRITMTVHSVDDVANQCKVRFFNGSSATATMNGTLYLMSVATD